MSAWEAEKAQKAIQWIHGAQVFGKKAGLSNMRRLLERLDIAPDELPFVHVAGTNGKGSTCAMIESVLRAAGYRTGLYTSPYLQTYHERIRIANIPLSDAELLAAVDVVRPAVEALRGEDVHCTVFEIGTAIALRAFITAGVEVAVLEVGLGGLFDPTNVILPRVCAIANIGLDHTRVLGDTLPEIAQNKAGIAKPGVPLVLHPATDEVYEVVRAACEAVHAPLLRLLLEEVAARAADLHGQVLDFFLPGAALSDISLPLPGAHQSRNALTAYATLCALSSKGFPISEEALRKGFASVCWPGRLEWLPGTPEVLLDGAHNAQGLQALGEYVRTYLQERRVVLLCGVLADKVNDEFCAALVRLAERAESVFCSQTEETRAMPASELADLLLRQEGNAETFIEPNPTEAFSAARCAAGTMGVVLCAGSLHFVGLLRGLWEAEQ